MDDDKNAIFMPWDEWTRGVREKAGMKESFYMESHSRITQEQGDSQTFKGSVKELRLAIEQARLRYEAALSRCDATFYLEPNEHPKDVENAFAANSPEHEEMLRKLIAIPFPFIRIVQTVLNDNHAAVDTEVICYGDGHRFGWVARDRNVITGNVSYTPTGLTPWVDNSIPMSYMRLMETWRSGRSRYEERPVSRQVRRRAGFAEHYHEFIVLRKPSKEQRQRAMNRKELMRRFPMLHAVSGHLRTYTAARYTFMRNKSQYIDPFTRGKGTLLQVKDYVTRAALDRDEVVDKLHNLSIGHETRP